MELRGIDISNGQGNINFDLLKPEVDFVIIRCGWGGDYTKQDDSKFNEYRQACIDRGIPYGVYLYSYALNTDSAKSEAAHTIRLLDGIKPPLGVWYDMEDADHYKQKHGINVYNARQLLTSFCQIYCDALIEAGYDCGIYANYDYWKNVLIKEALEQYPIWLAIWGPSQPPMPCKIWQYTNGGAVDGINGNVDMDILYTDEPLPTPEPIELTREISGMPILRKGSKGKAVQIWQIIVGTTPDGVFGDNTEAATLMFQTRYDIQIDGVVGPESWLYGINSI